MSCQSYNKHTLTNKVGEETIIFRVGKASQTQDFSIHKKLISKLPYWARRDDVKQAGPGAVLTFGDDDPNSWKLFVDWLYHGMIPRSPTKVALKTKPSALEAYRLETDLRMRFDENQSNLVGLYGLAEKYAVHNLMNQTIDNIQDGFHEYGTVFGPGLNQKVFNVTKKDSKLRELCVSTNIIHTDRGCSLLRKEIYQAAIMIPGYLPDLLKWISRNNVMFARRSNEGLFDISKLDEAFSMLNRKKLCPCYFHIHENGAAHKGHKSCAIPFLDCSHPGDEPDEEESDAALQACLRNALAESFLSQIVIHR
ncbi:hypothetical protein PVAG01_04758 [Phlyctema vagabunda]|uniref:BTB domain-containing protein n=1 Tax=Phlyctema vagabunda TaxID=108571 RepID=A0ABR4PI49_9HELO